MTRSLVAAAHRLLSNGAVALADVCGPATCDDTLLSALTVCEGVVRRLDRVVVGVVADLLRRGAFAERGYRNAVTALSDLMGWDRAEARRRVNAAEQICPRTALDGEVLPARLPVTAMMFAAGTASLRHVDVVARVLATPAARRLCTDVWAAAEAKIGAHTDRYTPSELLEWGTRLVDTLDQDGPEPDDRPPDPVNELHLRRHRGRPGGTLRGRFDDAAMFGAVAALLDAHARPVDADDRRTPAQRQAEAMADACRYVLDHGEVPERGGRRGHLNVLVRLEDLENRARAACLDLGGTLSPESLRIAVLRRRRRPRGARRGKSAPRRRPSHPHDPGRTAPRRHRPRRRLRPLRPSRLVVRGAPRGCVGARRPNLPGQPRAVVSGVSPAGPPRRMGGCARRRTSRVHPTGLDRPPPQAPTRAAAPTGRRVTSEIAVAKLEANG